MNKCHNCNGTGFVPSGRRKTTLTRKYKCYYCDGKGHRTSVYGKDGEQ